MKNSKVFLSMAFSAVLAFSLMVSGCGNTQQPLPNSNIYAQTNPYGYQTGYNTGAGYPIYGANGQIAGYRVSRPLYVSSALSFNGSLVHVDLGQVNAGDHVNPTGIYSLMLYKNCANGSGTISFNMGQNMYSMMGPTLKVNGQSISTYGNAIVPSAGTISFEATAIVSASCNFGMSATFSLVNPYSYSSYQTQVASVDSCVNTAGAAMACPN